MNLHSERALFGWFTETWHRPTGNRFSFLLSFTCRRCGIDLRCCSASHRDSNPVMDTPAGIRQRKSVQTGKVCWCILSMPSRVILCSVLLCSKLLLRRFPVCLRLDSAALTQVTVLCCCVLCAMGVSVKFLKAFNQFCQIC